MPTSAFEGRQFFTNHLTARAGEIFSIVDFGPGEGTYSTLGRHIIPRATWTAVEIFEPYIDRFGLRDKYDGVVIGDIRQVDLDAPYGLAIFGDVLEHLCDVEAVRVLETEAQRADHIYVSVPIIPAPQGPCHGNDHEEHLHDWTFEEMSDLLLSLGPAKWDGWRGHVVGRWWLDL